MEKKKLLLVAVSVGVVLLIIIGIPLLIIAPRQNVPSMAEAPVSAGVDQDRFMAFDPYAGQDPYRTPVETQSVLPSGAAGANTVMSTDTVQPAERVYTPPETETAAVTTITVPAPQTVAVPNVTAVAKPRKPAAVQPAPAKPAVKPAAQPAKPSPAVTKPAAAPAAKSATATATASVVAGMSSYWVQTGAFSTKVRAEGMKDSLESKGITSIIDNRDIDGKTWYRVRVGPYMSENEATYWLALVKSIDGFADSQVRLTPAVLR